MANDKVTWSELRKLVAQNSNITEQESGDFLNALLDAITAGLKEDKQVKIKGIGTFSLKSVAPRKSINIATGESFIIEGYNKLTFNAEATLKENVEKRIDSPKTAETVAEVLQDPIKKLGEQADEIVDILADLGQSPISIEPTKLEENTSKKKKKAQPILEKKEEKAISEAGEELVEDVVIDEPSHTEHQLESIPPTSTPPSTINTSAYLKWIGWIFLILLLCAFIGAGCYNRDSIVQWWQCVQDCQQSAEESVILTEDFVAEPKETIDEIFVEETIENTPKKIVPLAEQPRIYSEFIDTEVVTYGSRLTWIAYKYYGEKDLWVFIYEANRKQIENPNYLRMKQKIRIPKLDEKLKELSNPEVRKLVDDLAKEYLNK